MKIQLRIRSILSLKKPRGQKLRESASLLKKRRNARSVKMKALRVVLKVPRRKRQRLRDLSLQLRESPLRSLVSPILTATSNQPF